MDDPYGAFAEGFFARTDESNDGEFYDYDRFVTHIDDRAIAVVGTLYDRLGINGSVLDLCSSWISHFHTPPAELVALGMNAAELARNTMASGWVVHDLNILPVLPFPDDRFDAVTCCVSIDYLIRPIEVIREAARVLRPGGQLVVTFSNRCFPTKAIHGWLATNDAGHLDIVATYIRLAGGFTTPSATLCTPPNAPGDPLYAVWAAASSTEQG